MAEEPQNLRTVYQTAENRRKELEAAWDTNATSYQDTLRAAIKAYEQCLQAADRISLFSPNETLEDIASHDLQYLLLNYRIADLILKQNGGHRKSALQHGQTSYERFLRLLDTYDILSPGDARLLEQYRDSPTSFSTASTADAAARRETKIRRFREEKDLKKKLEYMQRNPQAIQNDDDMYRNLQLAQIAYCTHQTFQALESIAQELHILSMAPPNPRPGQDSQAPDARQRNGRDDEYSERLDSSSHLSAGLSGPMLSADGKPLRPFTLLGTRQRMQDGVFRPDHSLPTMTIDEYLDEERRRGGMIEGGGAQSGMAPEPNEDDYDKADEETLKARAWDEFVENNPKGSGNTLNRG